MSQLKAGIHVMPGKNGQLWIDTIVDLYKNHNVTIPFVTILDDLQRAIDLKRAVPGITILFRKYAPDDQVDCTKVSAQQYWDTHKLSYFPKEIDYYQFANEYKMDPKWEIEFMSLATKAGIHCTFMNAAVGTSFDPDNLPTNPSDLFWSMLRQGETQGHLLQYHGYSSEVQPYGDSTMLYAARWCAMRWTSWVFPKFPTLAVGLGEAGNFSANFLGLQSLALIKEQQAMTCSWDQLLGFSSWCGGYWADRNSDLTPIIQDWKNWVLEYSNKSTSYSVIVNTAVLNLREKASTTARILGSYPYGRKLQVASLTGVVGGKYHWLTVIDAKGKTLGYVSKEFTRV